MYVRVGRLQVGGRRGRRVLVGSATAAATAGAGTAGPRRWVPPGVRREAPGEPSHDLLFRRVRGILNKLTPEKFHKLSDDLLALDLDADKVLKGVILLIFEKALDEPKYSSMYAQLCKRLAEEAPNLEPPGQPCTFKLLLLNKCRTEFENRAQAFAAFEGRALSPDEEERRHLAKCKMLGNIKFIGELGKLEILSESILHRCIQKLLAGRAAAEHHEDLECLAQLVRTCGRVLDTERGRGLMDQYFARIAQLSASRELAPRIRFMLRDVAELRRGGWVPRAATAGEGPVPIQQLRLDEEFAPPPTSRREPLFRRPRPLDDVLAGLSLSPAVAPLPDKLFSNGFGGAPPRDSFRSRPTTGTGYFRPGGNKPAPPAPGKEPPRPPKSRLAPSATLDDVQMRPAANSLLFTANKLSKPAGQSLPLAPVPQNVLPTSFTSPPPLVKEPAITIKPAPDKKDKPKKEKGMSKEEVCEAARGALQGARDEAGLAAGTALLKELNLPDKLLRRAIAALLDLALADLEPHAPWAAAGLIRGVKRSPVLDALRPLVQARHPHDRLAPLLAHAVSQKLTTLAEVASLVDAPRYYPLLLDVLQQLTGLVGIDALTALYDESKINLASYVNAGSGEAGAAEEVEARGLGALVPQLRLQAELARQLASEPAPAALYRWMKARVEPAVRQHAAFVSALVAQLAAHVTSAAGSVGASPARAALDAERALLEAYAPLLTALLEGRADLQLAAVYAVQVHAHQLHYPKGLLLRWFMYLYNLEVVEEEAFLRWREDVTDQYPGKGDALFQVNAWLTWLQQQDSDSDDAED